MASKRCPRPPKMMGIDAKVDVKAFDDVKVDYGDEVMLRTPN